MNGNTDIDINIEIYIQRHNDGPMNTFRISKKRIKRHSDRLTKQE